MVVVSSLKRNRRWGDTWGRLHPSPPPHRDWRGPRRLAFEALDYALSICFCPWCWRFVFRFFWGGGWLEVGGGKAGAARGWEGRESGCGGLRWWRRRLCAH